ncbi:MAG: anti-sigma regulatory factor [Actinobacteria bacterium]|nr:MAG: anti-sigma regulatory factor [Actinomycetota bacterium]
MALGGGPDAAAAAVGLPAPFEPKPPAVSGIASAARAQEPEYGDGPKRVELREEFDIVTARGATRGMCAALGFPPVEQVKIATITSELARNIIAYAGRGYVELVPLSGERKGIEIRAVDNGPGIPNIDSIMAGGYSSNTGMGIGLLGTKRLMDEFELDSVPGRGTTVVTRKYR